jgi:hypothetical protein
MYQTPMPGACEIPVALATPLIVSVACPNTCIDAAPSFRT